MIETELPSRHPRQRGTIARQRIVSLLLTRSDSGSSPYTLEELHGEFGGSLTNLRHHLEWLQEHQVIRMQDALREVVRREVLLLNLTDRHQSEQQL